MTSPCIYEEREEREKEKEKERERKLRKYAMIQPCMHVTF